MYVFFFLKKKENKENIFKRTRGVFTHTKGFSICPPRKVNQGLVLRTYIH